MRQLKIEQSITNRDSLSLTAYFQELNTIDMISAEEEVVLAQQIKAGDELALNKLVSANLRFVVSVAKQYQHLGVGLNDLINEGNIGLVSAAKRFDETKGFKFISYAVWWIRQAIHVAIQQKGKVVRLPANKVGLLMKIKRIQDDFVQKNEREPDAEEIAKSLEVATSAVKSAMRAQTRTYSLDEPMGEHDDSRKIDVFVGEDTNNVDSGIEESSLKKDVKRLLSRLDSNEQFVITRFFGIGTDNKTLGEIADDLGLTKERIRQIKMKVIKKLRTKARPYMLESA
jgi:RNA polymerase primary sigma factor